MALLSDVLQITPVEIDFGFHLGILHYPPEFGIRHVCVSLKRNVVDFYLFSPRYSDVEQYGIIHKGIRFDKKLNRIEKEPFFNVVVINLALYPLLFIFRYRIAFFQVNFLFQVFDGRFAHSGNKIL